MVKETIPTCVDCGTQNCKYKDRTYPDFCPTENLKEEDRQWALERYDEGRNREIMIASAEVEYEGYCQWTRVQEIMEFARKIGACSFVAITTSLRKPLTARPTISSLCPG